MFVRRGIPACKSPIPPTPKHQPLPFLSLTLLTTLVQPALKSTVAEDAVVVARAPAPAQVAPPVPVAVSKRDSATTIDAVNLNVDGDAGVTMTFVESFDDDEEDAEDDE